MLPGTRLAISIQARAICSLPSMGLRKAVVGAQKVVPDLSTALRRAEEHCLPLENERAKRVYGRPSAINRILILNAEPEPGRGTVLLLREAIGF
jgi:hypothetical protein